MRKEVLILAKSIKKGGYCVAGREIERNANGRRVPGAHWVRPVLGNGERACSGAIPKPAFGRFRIGDIVQMDLARPAPHLAQQENWVWAGTPFRRVGEISSPRSLGYFADRDPGVWFDTSTHRDDQISEEYVREQRIEHSLTMITPTNLVFQLELVATPYGERRRIFVSFEYRGQAHRRIPMTDPALMKVFGSQFPQSPGATVNRTLNHGDNYWLTLSLSPLYTPADGCTAHHYVLVAAVIDHTGYLNRRYG